MEPQIKFKDDLILNSLYKSRPFLVDVRYVEDHIKKPVVVFLHGFKGFKDWGHFNLIADHIAKQGFVVVKFNFSHNGTTPEQPTEFTDLEAFSENNFSIELDDLGVVIDALINDNIGVPKEEINSTQLFVIGHSRGGSMALLKAHEDDRIKKVAAWAPIHSLSDRWPKALIKTWKDEGVYTIFNSRTGQEMPMKYQLIENLEKNQYRLDVPKAVKEAGIPMLLVHGTNDETLPYEHTQELAALRPDVTAFIVENANHVFGGKHPYLAAELPEPTLKILNKTLSFFHDTL